MCTAKEERFPAQGKGAARQQGPVAIARIFRHPMYRGQDPGLLFIHGDVAQLEEGPHGFVVVARAEPLAQLARADGLVAYRVGLVRKRFLSSPSSNSDPSAFQCGPE